MARTITVVTPENVEITYQAAGFVSRFMAFLIDLTVQVLLVILVLFLMRTMGALAAVGGLDSLVSAVGIVAVFVIMFFYALIFESLWTGRTPGKKLLGLRVIREGGYPLNFVSSAVRNILRFVDLGIFPIPGAPLILFGLPGLLSIFFSPGYKRLGDYAAGTLVIIEAGITPFGTQNTPAELKPNVRYYLPYVRNVERLTPDEYRLLRRFVARRADLELAIQAALGEKIARRLLPVLEISAPIYFQIQFADLLEAIEYRYAEERGVL